MDLKPDLNNGRGKGRGRRAARGPPQIEEKRSPPPKEKAPSPAPKKLKRREARMPHATAQNDRGKPQTPPLHHSHLFRSPSPLPEDEETPVGNAEHLHQEFAHRIANQGDIDTTQLGDVIGKALDINRILQLVEENDVTFIATETGTGKSTTIPKAIFERYEGKCKVTCTQPRRTATVRVASTVAQLCNKTLGVEVGYWMRGEKKGNDATELWYMTSYTLLLHLLNHRMQSSFSHIILDEFHERQPEIEMLAALLKRELAAGATFKLILMSATITLDEWQAFFSGLKIGKYTQAEGQHPVHEYFLEECSQLTGAAVRIPRQFDPQSSVPPSVVQNATYVTQAIIQYIADKSHLAHSILLFVPGRADAEKFKKWLDVKYPERFYPIIWHSHVDIAFIHKQLITPRLGRQKIYLATDIAEVSITLPDVVFVIDMCLVKRPAIQTADMTSLLYPPLVLQWVSKASLRQRKGRVGRTQQGFYFSMISRKHVGNLTNYPVPPIQQSRLDDLTLNLFHISNSPLILYRMCCSAPSPEAVDASVRSLFDLGAVYEVLPGTGSYNYEAQARSGRQYQVTFIGQVLQRLPVSVLPGSLVLYGLLFGMDALMILAASVAQSLSPFSPVTLDDREAIERGLPPSFEVVGEALKKAEESMRHYAKGYPSDIIASIYAYLDWRRTAKNRDLPWTEAEEDEWCAQRSLSQERLKQISELYFNIRDEMVGYSPGNLSTEELIDQLNNFTDVASILVAASFSQQAVQVVKPDENPPAPSTSEKLSNEMPGALQSNGKCYFLDAKSTLPDIHSPSCVDWFHTDVVVPVSLSLRYGKIVVSDNTGMPAKLYYLVLLIFTYRIVYSPNFESPIMAVIRNGKSLAMRVNNPSMQAIIDIRERLRRLMGVVLYRRERSGLDADEFEDVLQSHQMDWKEMQREAICRLRDLTLGPQDIEHVEQPEWSQLTSEHRLDCLPITSSESKGIMEPLDIPPFPLPPFLLLPAPPAFMMHAAQIPILPVFPMPVQPMQPMQPTPVLVEHHYPMHHHVPHHREHAPSVPRHYSDSTNQRQPPISRPQPGQDRFKQPRKPGAASSPHEQSLDYGPEGAPSRRKPPKNRDGPPQNSVRRPPVQDNPEPASLVNKPERDQRPVLHHHNNSHDHRHPNPHAHSQHYPAQHGFVPRPFAHHHYNRHHHHHFNHNHSHFQHRPHNPNQHPNYLQHQQNHHQAAAHQHERRNRTPSPPQDAATRRRKRATDAPTQPAASQPVAQPEPPPAASPQAVQPPASAVPPARASSAVRVLQLEDLERDLLRAVATGTTGTRGT